jgi:glutamate racemase
MKKTISSNNPIGVFDSGVGGLSVLSEIRRELPGENLLYVADSAHAPYGNKSREMIQARSVAIVEFLLSRNAKAIVVACNTATSAAVETLRARFSVPIVAMEPAVKPAAESTKSGVIGVLATSGTLGSENFARLHERFGAQADILVQPCPGLVELVEAGNLTGENTRALLEKYLVPLLEQRADNIVLGCTHYPFLTPLIREMAGPAVAILNPAPAVARELRRRLTIAGLLSNSSRTGTEQFWTSAQPDRTQPVIAQLWGEDIEVYSLPTSATA